MNIQELLDVYAHSAQSGALIKTLEDDSVKNIFLQGLVASSAPMFFASLTKNQSKALNTVLYILQDAEEAGYFYHDMVQLLGSQQVLFFPSTYRRQVKYGQRDAANEITMSDSDGFSRP